MKNDRLMRFVIVELSLRVNKIVEIAAKGPLTSASTAACGRYAKMNMKVVTPMPVVSIGASFATSGFHRLRWERK